MSSPPLPRVAILSATRTPIGRHGGALRDVPATVLGTVAARAAVERSGIPPPDIPEVIFGQCLQSGAGQNPARQVLEAIGISDHAGALTVNMVCGSGMRALLLGAALIRAGDAQVVLAGGMESMSMAPYLVPSKARWGLKYGPATLEDSLQRDALLDAYGEHEHMGMSGERVAARLGLTRSEADAFGVRSHVRAAKANADGTFAAETVPVPPSPTPPSKGLEHDEGPRPDTTLEGLARLRPSFRPDGLLTAGNSSQLSDGAAAIVLAGGAYVESRGLRPMAWLHSGAVDGVAPSEVMEAPIPTVRRHLQRVGLEPSDFDRVEHNEAFSSASIAVQRAFGFSEDRFNVHGGAVALGHPIGSSGARIVVSLVHDLVQSGGRLGLATLCMGGGNGLSLIVDRRGL
ncbi:MAG: acetyl-CoA C-acyltransferase [Thermoplasmata archaeon]|nr:acetyl-CoA C-acyltransferase [Thermoplasmata archaeon]